MKYAICKEMVTKTNKGAYQRMNWTRTAKTKKGCKDTIEKSVSATVRFGIQYDNLSVTKEGRANGTLPEQNAGLPWGKWCEYPFFIEHTKKGEEKATHYLRAYLGKNANVSTIWKLNGQVVPLEVVQPMLLASELKAEKLEAETPITVKISDITEIK